MVVQSTYAVTFKVLGELSYVQIKIPVVISLNF